jgi:curved DNA-binding protein CbpA
MALIAPCLRHTRARLSRPARRPRTVKCAANRKNMMRSCRSVSERSATSVARAGQNAVSEPVIFPPYWITIIHSRGVWFVRVLLRVRGANFRRRRGRRFTSTSMRTLYDLLGALPDDDAEGLRAAFRRAAKGAHPDINPGDPDAALKFREIVRANEILSDEEQRSAYDHLLDLARLEQESASRHALAARIHRLASATMAVTGILVGTIGGWLLFMHISAASVALPRLLSQIAAVSPADFQGANGQDASPAEPGSASVPGEANAPGAVAPFANTGSAPAAVYRSNPGGATPGLTQTIRFDPQFPAGFDPGIILYRPRKVGRAFADVAKAKPAEKASRTGPVPTIARKQRMATRATPVYPQRTAELDPLREPDPSRDEGFRFATGP